MRFKLIGLLKLLTLLCLNVFSRELIRGLEVSAGIYNLLDSSYGIPVTDDFAQPSILQDGRSFRVKATIRF